jgi:ribose transport system substrate-binding protein
MKKIFMTSMALILVLSSMVFAKGQTQGKYSVGMTVRDLSNQIYSGTCEELKRLVEADGGTFTYVDCKNVPATQISQVENFIASGVKAIVINVAEPNALEEVLGRARAKGIKVFCWGDEITNADINWLQDDYVLGQMVGEEAAKWINEKFNGRAEVGILNYPSWEVLLWRGNGIVETLKKNAPGANIVAEAPAIVPMEGMSNTETFLQAHPNIKVIACIGGGGAVGANEAVKSLGKLTSDFGIFAVDATEEELKAITDNEAIRMSVMITGGTKEIAAEIFDWTKKMINNEPHERRIMRKNIKVTKDNVAQYYRK